MTSEDPWYRGETIEDGLVEDEFDRRDALLRGDFSRWRAGGAHAFVEPWTGMPERFFLFRLEGTWYVGCKTLSDHVVYEGGSGLLCSRVNWSHVVGPLTGTRCSDADVRVGFEPLGVAERRRVFAAIGPETEILHPFPMHDAASGQEAGGPSEGWFLTEERAELLASGERHLRAYTHELFSRLFAAGSGRVTAYDPACSTGRFLADFAAIAPDRIRTVGQDLSAQMTGYAAAHLDEVHHGDALHPCLGERQADVVFSRFLNSEVVTTAQARAILPGLVRTVRKGGLLVLFGHTPVLLDSHDLTAQGLRVRQTTGRHDGSVFQYYVCDRPD